MCLLLSVLPLVFVMTAQANGIAPRQRSVAVHKDRLLIRTRDLVGQIDLSELRSVVLSKTSADTAQLRFEGRSPVTVGQIPIELAYRMRHLVSHLAELEEPGDVQISRHFDWQQTRFAIGYPAGMNWVRIVVAREGFTVTRGSEIVGTARWQDVTRLARTPSLGIVVTGHFLPVTVDLIPPTVADDVYETMRRQWDDARSRNAQPDDPEALRAIRALQQSSERE